MIDPVTLAAFVPIALALNLTPGPDMAFCVAQGMGRGARAGWAASAGVALGCMVHVTVAGMGLGAFLAAHPAAFDAIRWAGVAYLLWLAWRAFAAPAAAMPAGRQAGRALLQGFATNLLNPKIILFVLAFLPQFTDPARPLLPQFLILGAVIALGGLVVNGVAGAMAGRLGREIAGTAGGTARGGAGRWIARLSGTIFAGLALRLAFLAR
ncbi:MAG: LysE family translocator [Rubellimicrobium sp.]|nr:LysE family translocator [Rubellimicrobium sp.]